MSGDGKECALRAATVLAGSRICRAVAAATAAATAAAAGDAMGGQGSAAAAQGGGVGARDGGVGLQAWQLSMYLLHGEEQRRRRGQPQVAGGDDAGGIWRHVAKSTLAY